MRLPADCGFSLRTPQIRIALGRITTRRAHRSARVLAMGASIQLERMRRDMMTGQNNTNAQNEIVARLRSDAMALLPLLAGLDDVDRCNTSVPELAPRMVAAGLDPRLMAMFHGIRHAKINRDRELKIDPRTFRLQVGHETADMHQRYGKMGMNRAEGQDVLEVPLLPEIDLSVFRKLDFAALAPIHLVPRQAAKAHLSARETCLSAFCSTRRSVSASLSATPHPQDRRPNQSGSASTAVSARQTYPSPRRSHRTSASPP
jgi:hypothetical protein